MSKDESESLTERECERLTIENESRKGEDGDKGRRIGRENRKGMVRSREWWTGRCIRERITRSLQCVRGISEAEGFFQGVSHDKVIEEDTWRSKTRVRGEGRGGSRSRKHDMT